MAARSSGMPSMLVYLVSPRLMAAMAASLMLSGVSKSGSPAARPITSRPCAFRSRDFCVIARVGDGLMRFKDCARKPDGRADMLYSDEKRRGEVATTGGGGKPKLWR